MYNTKNPRKQLFSTLRHAGAFPTLFFKCVIFPKNESGPKEP